MAILRTSKETASTYYLPTKSHCHSFDALEVLKGEREAMDLFQLDLLFITKLRQVLQSTIMIIINYDSS